MATPKQLPDAKALHQLRLQGMMLTEIAREFGVTTTAVWHALERAGLGNPPPPTYQDVVPWAIAPEHRALQILQQFRRLAKIERGQPLDEIEQRRFDKWVQALNEDNLVVAYHPDAPPNTASVKGGFYYVPREAADGDRIWRDPVYEAERLEQLKHAHAQAN